jgi:hypothetical protein
MSKKNQKKNFIRDQHFQHMGYNRMFLLKND